MGRRLSGKEAQEARKAREAAELSEESASDEEVPTSRASAQAQFAMALFFSMCFAMSMSLLPVAVMKTSLSTRVQLRPRAWT